MLCDFYTLFLVGIEERVQSLREVLRGRWLEVVVCITWLRDLPDMRRATLRC